MRQAVTFNCKVCQFPIHRGQIIIHSEVRASRLTVRLCSWACLVAWVVRGG